MTKIYQIANGRWQITAEYDNWKYLSPAFAAAILWASFATKADAEKFTAAEWPR